MARSRAASAERHDRHDRRDRRDRSDDTPGRRWTLRRLMFTTGVVVVLVLVAAAIAIYSGLAGSPIPTGPAKTAVQGFLTDLEDQNYQGAFNYLCKSTTATFQNADALAAHEKDLAPLTGWQNLSVDTQTVNGVDSASVKVDLVRGGSVQHHVIPMVETGSVWQVCGEPY